MLQGVLLEKPKLCIEWDSCTCDSKDMGDVQEPRKGGTDGRGRTCHGTVEALEDEEIC